MRILSVFVLIFVLSSCAARVVVAPRADEPTRKKSEQEIKLDHVVMRWSKEEVLAIMGNSVTVGYQEHEGVFEPITVKNPYKVELLHGMDKVYEVFYYFLQSAYADQHVSDEELIPVVFVGGEVVAKGWDGLAHIQENL